VVDGGKNRVKKFLVLISVAFVAICGVFLAFSPDILSLIVVGVMFMVILFGHIFGVVPNLLFCDGFRNGCASIDSIHKIAADSKWAALRQIQPFFHQKTLDSFFESYLDRARKQQNNGLIVGDVEDFINEDSLELRNWRGVVLQISGVLTALGLLGTFLGLMTGISSVVFSTLDATIASIETLLQGIATAFYTSIVGVILSVIFNLVNRIVWNYTVREMNLFLEAFHTEIQPYSEEQLRAKNYLQNEEMIRLLTQINNAEASSSKQLFRDTSYEQRLMVQVFAGVKNGEFSTVYEPVCKLEDRSVIKVVAQLCWKHGTLGIIHNSVYFPIIEANGYLIQLEKQLWRDVAKELSDRKKSGLRTVPVVLSASKIFLMSTDIVQYINDLIAEFDLMPRDFEVSLPADVYMACHSEVIETERHLRKTGYRVSIHGYGGDLLDLPETNAEELVVDLNMADPERISDIFSWSLKKNLMITAENIVSARQLTLMRKCGCEYGRGRHLYPEMTSMALADLIDGETV